MASHRQLLEERAADAERAYLDANREVERLHGQVVADRQAVEQLTQQYDHACRELATGASVDPAKILSERDRRVHRLKGLEALEREATAAATRANEPHVEASRALQEEIERGEFERLWSLVRAAEERKKEAADTLAAASRELDRAVFAKDAFRKQMERNAKARA